MLWAAVVIGLLFVSNQLRLLADLRWSGGVGAEWRFNRTVTSGFPHADQGQRTVEREEASG